MFPRPTSLLPIGLIQAKASISTGLWYARGLEISQSPWIQNLRWFRIAGDIIFAFGGLLFATAVLDRAGVYSFNEQPMVNDENEPVTI